MDNSVFGTAEHGLYQLAEWVKLVVEGAGILIIAWGVLFSLWCYGRNLFGHEDKDYIPLRLSLARYLIVALEFQLAADILGTAIAPDWDQIGKLGAIAIIRTVLNFFLQREIERERELQETGGDSLKDDMKEV